MPTSHTSTPPSFWTVLWGSAVPVLMVLSVLFGGVYYLDQLAHKYADSPIVIKVTPVTEELEFEEGYGPRINQSLATLFENDDLSDNQGVALKVATVGKSVAQIHQELQTHNAAPEAYSFIAIQLSKAKRPQDGIKLLQNITPKSTADKVAVNYSLGKIYHIQKDIKHAMQAFHRVLSALPKHCPAMLALGLLEIEQSQPHQALGYLLQAQKQCSAKRRVKAFAYSGIAYTRVKQYARAVTAYTETVRLSPTHLAARINLAALYRDKLQDTKLAKKWYLEALKLNSNYGIAYVGLGLTAKTNGEIATAIGYYKNAIRVEPQLRSAHLQLAITYLSNTTFEKMIDPVNQQIDSEINLLKAAKKELDWLVATYPEYSPGYFYRGKLLYKEGNYQAAANSYGQSISLTKGDQNTSAEALNNIALCHKALKDYPQALSWLDKAIKQYPEYSTAYYNRGLVYAKLEDYEKAAKSYVIAIKHNLKFAPAYYNLAIAYGVLEQDQLAIDNYQKVLSIDPSHLKARVNLAVRYRAIGELDESVKQYRLINQLRPTYASAWYNLGVVLRQQNELNEAEAAYRQAIKLAPGQISYQINLAVLLSIRDQHKEAANLLATAITATPNNARLYYNLSLQQRALTEHKKALKSVMQAVILDDKYIKGWLLLGDLADSMKAGERALKAYQTAAQLDPLDLQTKLEIAKQFYRLKRYKEAAVVTSLLIKLDSKNGWTWYTHGKISHKLGHEQEASSAYKKAISLDKKLLSLVQKRAATLSSSTALFTQLLEENKNNPELKISLAQQLARKGQTSAALRMLQELLQQHPSNALGWRSLAKLQGDTGALQDAEKSYKQGVLLDDKNYSATYALGKLLYKQGKYKEAISYLTRAHQLDKSNNSAMIWLGRALRRNGDLAEAQKYFETVYNNDPKNHLALLGLGDIAHKNNNDKRALRLYKEALKLKPSSKDAKRKSDKLATSLLK